MGEPPRPDTATPARSLSEQPLRAVECGAGGHLRLARAGCGSALHLGRLPPPARPGLHRCVRCARRALHEQGLGVTPSPVCSLVRGGPFCAGGAPHQRLWGAGPHGALQRAEAAEAHHPHPLDALRLRPGRLARAAVQGAHPRLLGAAPVPHQPPQGHSIYFDTLRECYEAFVIYHFFTFLLVYLEQARRRRRGRGPAGLTPRRSTGARRRC